MNDRLTELLFKRPTDLRFLVKGTIIGLQASIIDNISGGNNYYLTKEGLSKDYSFQEAVTNFDNENQGFNVSEILNSNIKRTKYIEEVLSSDISVANAIVGTYFTFYFKNTDDETIKSPIFTFELGLCPSSIAHINKSIESSERRFSSIKIEISPIILSGTSTQGFLQAYNTTDRSFYQ